MKQQFGFLIHAIFLWGICFNNHMTTLYLVRKWFLKSVKQYSKWECGLSSSPTSPWHAGIQGRKQFVFNSNMSYRAWLCVTTLRSYMGFRVTLVYELTSYTR